MDEMKFGMGLPPEFSTPALTIEMAYRVIGNGVPLQLGRALANAVIAALEK